MKLIVLGLSLSSSWGNGHATTYRALLKAFAERGHQVHFLERNVRWYAGENRDLSDPDWCRLSLYEGLADLQRRHAREIAAADAVLLGSYVPEGVEVAKFLFETARGIVAFYDIDTPVTLGKLSRGDHEYVSPEVIPGFDIYFSFAGGPTLDLLERQYGAPRARALYCAVDPSLYHPLIADRRWDLGYLGTYSPDRQPKVERLLLETARRMPDRRFVVAGPSYPDSIAWPANVDRIDHVPPARHAEFYSASRATLNITRQDMVAAGWSPSVRLFEAAACGVPILSDRWDGIEDLFDPGSEISLVEDADEVEQALKSLDSMQGVRARSRILRHHSAAHRAEELESELLDARPGSRSNVPNSERSAA